MRKCIRCGSYHDNKKICNSCLIIWTSMRGVIWETMTIIHGSFSPETQKEWVNQTKKLEKTWRKDPEEFKKQIKILKGDTEVSNG